MIAKGDITRFVGDAICLVVGETQDGLDSPELTISLNYTSEDDA